jgi:23S rRNA (uracil1939-C5)-methyltransferase
MTSCEVLPPHLSRLLVPLREVIGQLSIRQRVPQVEVAAGDEATALVLRILEPLDAADGALLSDFAQRQEIRLYLQPAGPDSAYPFAPSTPADLKYTLPEFGLTLHFSPTDFTQVNHAVNRVLVRRALQLLGAEPGERIGDLFCGIGNFALAIARRGASVLGIEGSEALIARAKANAAANGLASSAEFRALDLFAPDAATVGELKRRDRLLIDPPRDGAIEVVKALGPDGPRRIAYVSCNPATLARDASVLVHTQGYTLSAAGVVNMFPHTSHVESIAVFDR